MLVTKDHKLGDLEERAAVERRGGEVCVDLKNLFSYFSIN